MSDLRLGVPAEVAFGYAPARGLEPRRVEHLQLGITWDVTGILDRWTHPGPAEDAVGKATLIKWWLLRVCGPLPGRPAARGEFIMEASLYGDPLGWWITVGAADCRYAQVVSSGAQGRTTGFVQSATEGEAIELPGWSMRVKVTADDTAGRPTEEVPPRISTD